MNRRCKLIATASAILTLTLYGCSGRTDLAVNETRTSAVGEVFFSLETPLGSKEELIVEETSAKTLTLAHYYYGWSAFGGGWVENKWPGRPIIHQAGDTDPIIFGQYSFEVLDISMGKATYKRIR